MYSARPPRVSGIMRLGALPVLEPRVVRERLLFEAASFAVSPARSSRVRSCITRAGAQLFG